MTGEAWRWTRTKHVLCTADGKISCVRCRGAVPAARRRSMEDRWCAAWLARSPPDRREQDAEWDWGALVVHTVGLKVAGGGEVPGRRPQQRQQPEALCLAERPPEVPEPRPLEWRAHAAALGPGFVACAVCGGTAATWAVLARKPCPGWTRGLKPRAAALFLFGPPACAGGPAALFAAAAGARSAARPRAPD